jgi:AcrR family transcriptional regulator
MAVMASNRLTAEERRSSVLAAAITEFARSGYTGTSTEAIAARAGISQPYLFRLFGTKKDLFVATYDLVASRIINELTRAGEGLEGAEAKEAMGAAYLELMQDPEMLQVQLHGFAAAPADPDIARSCRRTFEVLAGVFYERTHLSDQDLWNFFAMGMLINVVCAIDLLSFPDTWAEGLCPLPEKVNAIKAASQALADHHRGDQAPNLEVIA